MWFISDRKVRLGPCKPYHNIMTKKVEKIALYRLFFEILQMTDLQFETWSTLFFGNPATLLLKFSSTRSQASRDVMTVQHSRNDLILQNL